MRRIRILVPKNIDAERELNKLLSSEKIVDLEEVRVNVSDEDYDKINKLSERLGIPLKYLFLVLLLSKDGIKKDMRPISKPITTGEVKEVDYYDTRIKLTDSLEVYTRNIEKLKESLKKEELLQPFIYGEFTNSDIRKLTENSWEWVNSNKDLIYLHYKSLDQLYEMQFDSYEDYVLHFLFIYAPYKSDPKAFGLYGLNFMLSTEYILPPSLYSKSAAVGSWIHFTEPTGSMDHLHQEDIQETLGRLMDSHYLDWENISPTELPDPDWVYEDVSSFKERALNGAFPYNPMLLGRKYRIAPVEVLIPSDVKNIPTTIGRKLREFFKKMLEGKALHVWYGKFKEYDILAFRSGYFVIGKIKNPVEAISILTETFYEWLKGKKFPHYAEFFKDKMIASYIHWLPEEPLIAGYNNTSSIAYFASSEKKVVHYWNKVLLRKVS